MSDLDSFSVMDDIEALFASLAAAQTQQVAQRLMERNIVDLVQKLRDQGLQLYPTKDGKEYVTPDQVEREILDAIAAHGGRMQVRSLDDELNMPQEVIDCTLERLLASSRGKMRVMEGDVITAAYLDTICEEINSQLVEAGELHIGKLASTHSLTVADMENALASRLGTFVHGRVERQVLFTTAFIQKQTAIIIGALTATTRPTSTLDIIQRFRLQPELFETTLRQLMECGRIKGELSGKRFIPNSFIHAQSRAVKEFFQSNNCISWGRIEALQVSVPKTGTSARIEQRWSTPAFSTEPIRKMFPEDSIAVSCGVVSPSFLQTLESEFAAELTSKHCVDISTLVPDDFSSDTEAFVQRMPQLIADGNVLMKPSDDTAGAVVLLSGTWLKRVRDAIASHTQSVGHQYSKILSAAPAPTPSSLESKGKKKASSRDTAAAAAPRLEDLIDLNLEFDRAVKSLGAAVDASGWCWTRETLLPFLKTSIDSAARTAQHVAPVVSHKVLAGHFIEAMHTLQATLNGINFLSLDSKAKEAITKHVLKCLGGNLLNIMINSLVDPVVVSSFCPAGSSMTSEVRTKILLKANDDSTAVVEAANKAVAKGIAADALAAIDVAAKSLEFLVKPLDAKAERVALQKSKDELLQELKLCGSSDTSKTLILGTCLAVVTYTSRLIMTPRNCVNAVLDALVAAAPPSPAFEESIAALRALESIGDSQDALAAPAVLRVKHALSGATDPAQLSA